MKLLRETIYLMALLAWLPASSHCILEDAGWLPHDACCADKHNSGSGHSDKSGPCQVEDGAALTVSRSEIEIPLGLQPDVVFPAPLPQPGNVVATRVWSSSHERTPYLSRSWQWWCRTARPARAPCPLS
jgi:hypothetical protein